MQGKRNSFTASRGPEAKGLFSTTLLSLITTTTVLFFFTTIKLVVVMSAVKLWKAQQPLLSERPSVTFQKWQFVGNGEKTALDQGSAGGTKISSATLNRISASSPTSIHRSRHANFAGRHAEEQPVETPSPGRSPRRKKSPGRPGREELNVTWEKRQSYCKVSIKRVMVRLRSLSDRRISSILLMECSTVV